MEPEWLKVATSPGLWIIGFIFAGNALIQSWLVLPAVATRGDSTPDGRKRE